MLQNALSSFLSKLNRTYNIPISELEDRWNEADRSYQMVWNASYRLHYKERKLTFRETKRDTDNGCQAILKTGKNKGEKCGKRTTTETENMFCGMHGKKFTHEFLISKNAYGNFEHKKTGFLFDKKRKVIGKQGYFGVDSGKILELSDEDFETCEKYGFKTDKINVRFESDDDNISVAMSNGESEVSDYSNISFEDE